MKKKINLRLIIVSVIAVIAATAAITFVYYNLFQDQVKKDLRIQAKILCGLDTDYFTGNTALKTEKDIRITLISKDGTVLYDNDADTNELTNHLDRPEVKQAIEKGSGESVRKSDTMNMRTFYYALTRADGSILRVAIEARGIASVFLSVFPVIMIIIIAIIFICVIVSSLLTRQLLAPIGRMADDLDNPMRDSAYKELEPFMDRIRQQHESVLSAAKARADFSANVSHELKTPITAISGYAQLIENKMADEEQTVQFAGEIRKNSSRLLTLINDIIELSRLDHPSSLEDFTNIDLYEIAKDRVKVFESSAKEKDVTVNLEGESCILKSTKTLMNQLVDNFLQNAIRYNVKGGKVDISVRKKDGNVVLTVADTGIGIPKEDCSRIFERFYRVDKSHSRETGGTGLGLAIVKHIVEIQNGKIELESEINKGTVFTVKL